MENSFLSLKYLKGHTALGMLILSFSRRESLKLKQKFCFINRNFKTFPAGVYHLKAKTVWLKQVLSKASS